MRCGGGGAKDGAHEQSARGRAVLHERDTCSTSARASAIATCTSTANGQMGAGTDAMGGGLSESSSSVSVATREARATGMRSGLSARAPTRQSLRGAARREGREKLSWKATFIELCDEERQSSLSPRPSSEPCSESSSSRSALFDADRISTAALSKHMERAWASNSRETMRKLLSAAPKSDSQSEGHEEGADDHAMLNDGDSCSSSAQASAVVTRSSIAQGRTGTGTDAMGRGLSESSSTDSASAHEARATGMRSGLSARAPTRQSLRGAARREGREKLSWKATFIELCDEERQSSLSPRPSSEPCSESSSSRSALFDADRISTAALSKHMERAWASNSRETMRNRLEKQRLSAAAEAIGNIPEQLSSVVQNKAKSLAESVKTDLSLVQKAIRRSGGDEDVVDVAIDQLGKIPEIVRSSFDSKIMEANGAIRLKLSAIMQSVKSFTPESQEMVTQLWTIPEELEQITGEAVDQAVQESKREATKHCDRVLRSLPEDAGVSRQALRDAKLHIAEAVPEMYSETMRALRRTTKANVKHAVAHVDDPSEVPVTNRLIADALLRAKADTLLQSDGASMSQSSYGAVGIEEPGTCAGEGALVALASLDAGARGACYLNAGSMGHPEMCVRPCLYFLQGKCTNGGGCRFCHYQHSARPVHLGRQHRKTLEAATAVECFGISVPLLERKMIAMNLATDTLKKHSSQQCAGQGGAAVDAGSRVKLRELRTLEKAFGALSMRSLLVVLQRKAGAQASREKTLVDALRLELRDAGLLVDIGEEAREDA